jgi:hypothetical protein
MSSGISTELQSNGTGSPAGGPAAEAGQRRAGTPEPHRDESLQPWQLFVLAALACATASTFLARGQGIAVIILFSVLMMSAALVGLAALRTVWPLVGPDEDRTSVVGGRTRAALEREKALVLRSIKELEFDRAMGKVSDTDWQEMSARLRARATRLIRQLDAGAGYRDRIERDLAEHLARSVPAAPIAVSPSCGSCGTTNDADAKFCKKCGAKL